MGCFSFAYKRDVSLPLAIKPPPPCSPNCAARIASHTVPGAAELPCRALRHLLREREVFFLLIPRLAQGQVSSERGALSANDTVWQWVSSGRDRLLPAGDASSATLPLTDSPRSRLQC